jgi:hypothetical protein
LIAEEFFALQAKKLAAKVAARAREQGAAAILSM